MVNTPAASRENIHHHSEPAPGKRVFTLKATGEAAKAYDFKAARGPQKTTNVIESIAHLIKGSLGAGLVSVHEAYSRNGLVSSLILNILYGFLIGHCMCMLTQSAQKMYGRIQEPILSYPDLAEATVATGPFPGLKRFSKCFRHAVDAAVSTELFGTCCVYQIIIARTLKQLVEGINESPPEGLNGLPHLRIYVLALGIPCLLICLIRNLKYLAPFSIVADILILIIAVSTVYYGTSNIKKSPFDFPYFKTVGGFFEFTGACVFSMDGIGVMIPVENHMTHPKKIRIVIVGAMSFVIGNVILIGFFGYWGYGESSISPITLNFPFGPFPYCLKMFMAVLIFVTFALNFWVPFNLVWVYIQGKHAPEKHWLWERVYRAAIVTVITLVAFIFPSVTSFIALLGSACLANLGFIFPAIIEMLIDWQDPGHGFLKLRLLKWILIMMFGLILCIFGTYSSARNLIRELFLDKK